MKKKIKIVIGGATLGAMSGGAMYLAQAALSDAEHGLLSETSHANASHVTGGGQI